jgi:hypothetical protein
MKLIKKKLWYKSLDDSNLLPTLKKIHNLNFMEFEILLNSKYVSKTFIFKFFLPDANVV